MVAGVKKYGVRVAVAVVFALPVGFYIFYMGVQPFMACGLNGDCVVATWKDWQTLNAAVLAFVPAYGLYWLQSAEKARIKRDKAKAARALLSSQLDKLTTLCDGNITLLIEQKNHFERKEARDDPACAPDDAPDFLYSPFGEEHFRYFKECMEVDEASFSQELAELLQWMQIVNARNSSLRADLRGETHGFVTCYRIYARTMDMACLRARLGALFPYCRGHVESYEWKALSIKDLSAVFTMQLENPLDEGAAFLAHAKQFLDKKRYLIAKDRKPSG